MIGATLSMLSLNTWGGKEREPLLNYLEAMSWVDVLCFQEVFNNAPSWRQEWGTPDLYRQIAAVLPNHRGFYAPSQTNDFGLAMFIRQNIEVERAGEAFVHRWRDAQVDGQPETLGRNLQFADIKANGHGLTVAHVHGLWTGEGKGDTPERLEQAAKIRMFRDLTRHPLVLSGDFNLRPETESLAIIKEGMIDLIEVGRHRTTRSQLYPGWQTEPLADYMLVDKSLAVELFAVQHLRVSVSDHLPLLALITLE